MTSYSSFWTAERHVAIKAHVMADETAIQQRSKQKMCVKRAVGVSRTYSDVRGAAALVRQTSVVGRKCSAAQAAAHAAAGEWKKGFKARV